MDVIAPITRPQLWTAYEVGEWIKEAVETAKLLHGDRPKGYKAYWPEILRKSPFEIDIKEYRGKHDFEGTRLYAENDAIDRFDEVQEWMAWLRREEVQIIWSWAIGAPDTWIGRKVNKHRNTVRTYRRRILEVIARKLNRSAT